MAASTIDSELILLIDKWPGVAQDKGSSLPTTWFLATANHNTAAQGFRMGEKYSVWNNSNAGKEGQSTFIYLQLNLDTGAPTAAIKQVCVPDSETTWFIVTNDPDDCIDATGSPFCAVMTSTMTADYFGWFWCGGVCPECYIPLFTGNFITEDNLAAGGFVAHDMDDVDAMSFGPPAGNTETIIGFALATDA